MKAIKDFDSEHANDNEFVDKAKSKSKDNIFWLYLVRDDNNVINAVPTMSYINEMIANSLNIISEKNLKTTSLIKSKNTKDSVFDQAEKF